MRRARPADERTLQQGDVRGGEALAGLLLSRRILVVGGTGGVGKTTVAAALAVEAARRGRQVLVLTIDPARRLQDSLELEPRGARSDPRSDPRSEEGGAGRRDRSDAPRPLSSDAQATLGIVDGSLHAVMLDMKSTFDGLVDRFADGPAAKQRILDNPIYQHVSDALAGSGEYAAMEKVFELAQSDDYDLILVDTPPSQHALDFLDAPRRLLEFLDSRVVQLLFHPAMAAGRFGFRIFSQASRRVLQVLERISGVGFLEDISEFLLAFEAMSEGFRERAQRVRQLLVGPGSGFLVVAGPSPEAARAAFEFLANMRGTGVPVEGVLVNRMHAWPGDEPVPSSLVSEPTSADEVAALARALESASSAAEQEPLDAAAAAGRAVELARGYASLVEFDERSAAPLREYAARNGQLFARIPELPEDVCDLRGLLRIGDLLFRAEPSDAAEAPASAVS